MDNPLVPSAAAAADEAAFQAKVMHKAALARTAGDWFDIFDEVTTNAVVKTMESHGDSPMDVLHDWKDDRAAVRREFVAHELPLTEEVEFEGPVPDPERPTDQTAILWPAGQFINFHWPDGSRLSFRGRKAIIALSFILWWDGFHSAYKVSLGQQVGGQSRVIEPGSPEWLDYYKNKKAGG